MDNSKIIGKINQHFHNMGIKQESRFDTLLSIIQSKNTKFTQAQNEYNSINELLDEIDYANKDLIQELFMSIGSKFTKFKLDQFYTPLTISEFICGLMDGNGSAIDPAGGTGDLLLYYPGKKTVWDIDENALKLCKFNYELNQMNNYELVCKNSLMDFEANVEQHNYVVMNPPFGTSTLITDNNILKNFELGNGKKNQEIGILFIELGLKLLKKDGIMFIILPTGYLGNVNKTFVELRNYILKYKILTVLELPKNTFKRSGTGVNTNLLIIQKTTEAQPYKILISKIENIGYNLTKKETPKKYKVVPETGVLVTVNDTYVLDNDLVVIAEQFKHYYLENNNSSLSESSEDESVMSDQLDANILDIKRYQRIHLNIRALLLNKPDSTTVNVLATITKKTFKVEKNKKYKYIDIGEINSPLHSYKELYGWELPSRAKYLVKKNDILISKLEGTMSYCVILQDDDNLVATNGVVILRPKNLHSLYVLFSNIMKSEFKIQHNAYLTGSIMASLTDEDVGTFLVDTTEDIQLSKKIIDTLEILSNITRTTV